MPLISAGRFNGGTITQPLVIHVADPTVVPLEIRASWSAITQDFLRVSNTDNDGDLVVIDPSAQVVVSHHTSGATEAKLGEFGNLLEAPQLGFYGSATTPQQTGVPVTAAAIHAALVSLGLITA